MHRSGVRKMLKDLSYSDSELDQIDLVETPELQTRSHFFAPPHYRFSSPTPDSPGALSGGRSDGGSTSSTECLGESAAEGLRYENKDGLAHDLTFLATMPELCDVTFLVGEDRQPVCAVRAILAARSRVFRRMLYSNGGGGAGAGSKKPKKKKKDYRPPDGYIERYDFRGQPTVVVQDFEPEVFKQLVEYTHTGSVMLQARCLLGLMNAADHYGLEELKLACVKFMEHCVTTDTVCSLLISAEKYIQYKSTKILVQKMFEFVDQNAEAILSLGAFATLPQHVVRIVLGREELRASETSKFNAAFRWALHHCDDHPAISMRSAFEPFVGVIDFFQIPAKHLMGVVKPAGIVSDTLLLNALAFQADPKSVEHLQSHRPHRYAPSSPQMRRVQSSECHIPSQPAPSQIRGSSVPPLDSHPGCEEAEVYPADSQLSMASTINSSDSSCSIGGGGGGRGEGVSERRMAFNSNALDTIVTLSNSKSVEV